MEEFDAMREVVERTWPDLSKPEQATRAELLAKGKPLTAFCGPDEVNTTFCEKAVSLSSDSVDPAAHPAAADPAAAPAAAPAAVDSAAVEQLARERERELEREQKPSAPSNLHKATHHVAKGPPMRRQPPANQPSRPQVLQEPHIRKLEPATSAL